MKTIGKKLLSVIAVLSLMCCLSVATVSAATDSEKEGLTNLVNQVIGYQSDMFTQTGWTAFTQARTAAQAALANADSTQADVDAAYTALDTSVKGLQAVFKPLATLKSDSAKTTLTQVTDASGILAAPSGITGLTAYKATGVIKNQNIACAATDKNLKDYNRLFMYVRADGVSGSIGSIRLQVMDNVTWGGDPVPFDAYPVSDKWIMLTLDLTGTKLQSFMNGTKQVGGYSIWVDFACTSLYVSSVYAVKDPNRVALSDLVNKVIKYREDAVAAESWPAFSAALTNAQQILANPSAKSSDVLAAVQALESSSNALKNTYSLLATPLTNASGATVDEVNRESLATVNVPAVPPELGNTPIYKATNRSLDKISTLKNDTNLKDYKRVFVYVYCSAITNTNMRFQVMSTKNWNEAPVTFNTTLTPGKWSLITLDLSNTGLTNFMNGNLTVGAYAIYTNTNTWTELYISQVFGVKTMTVDPTEGGTATAVKSGGDVTLTITPDTGKLLSAQGVKITYNTTGGMKQTVVPRRIGFREDGEGKQFTFTMPSNLQDCLHIQANFVNDTDANIGCYGAAQRQASETYAQGLRFGFRLYRNNIIANGKTYQLNEYGAVAKKGTVTDEGLLTLEDCRWKGASTLLQDQCAQYVDYNFVMVGTGVKMDTIYSARPYAKYVNIENPADIIVRYGNMRVTCMNDVA